MLRFLFAIILGLAVFALAQTSPLIMKHADNLDVSRGRGTLLLQGKVHFVHDSATFRTERAVWHKDNEEIQCDGGFLLTHPSGYVQARSGNYKKKQGMASAAGDVRAADSANTYMFTGDYLVYDREKEILTMPSKPVLYQFEKQKDGHIDTVKIQAKKIIYNKGESFAQAFDSVKITQREMVVTCDTGIFNRQDNWLSMKGHPTCDMNNYHLTGDSIFIELDSAGKTLKSALVIRNAHGTQKEEPKRNAPGSVTEAFGDTLYCEFKDDKIERLYVNLNAKGFFYETDLPDYRNLMDGDRLDLYFNKGKMDHAVVSGKAQSTYYYVKNDRTVSGKNEAAGDTINIVFDAAKNAVRSLRLLGNTTLASGRYVDLEKERRNKEAKEKARLDSLKALGIVMTDTTSAKTKQAVGPRGKDFTKGENPTIKEENRHSREEMERRREERRKAVEPREGSEGPRKGFGKKFRESKARQEASEPSKPAEKNAIVEESKSEAKKDGK